MIDESLAFEKSQSGALISWEYFADSQDDSFVIKLSLFFQVIFTLLCNNRDRNYSLLHSLLAGDAMTVLILIAISASLAWTFLHEAIIPK